MGMLEVIGRDLKEFYRDNLQGLFLQKKGVPVFQLPNARFLINEDELPPKYRPKKTRIIIIQ